MRMYHVFQSKTDPKLRAYTDDPTGSKLPDQEGPWTLLREIHSDGPWTEDIARQVVSSRRLRK